jgi:hypothetical protein
LRSACPRWRPLYLLDGQWDFTLVSALTYTVPGERHSGGKPEAFNRALRCAAEPWMPAVSKQP